MGSTEKVFREGRYLMAHVICKSCSNQISVAGKPKGATTIKNVQAEGNVRIGDGGISFGKRGGISFKKGGSISFGAPRPSTFSCPKCGTSNEYSNAEIIE